MGLTFGGRVPEERAAPPPAAEPSEREWLAISRIDSAALLYWFEATRLQRLEERIGRVEERLDDPALADHPMWGDGWNRLARMQGERKESVSYLNSLSVGAMRDWRVLSAAGKAHVRRLWGLADDETPVERIVAEADAQRLMPMIEKPPF